MDNQRLAPQVTVGDDPERTRVAVGPAEEPSA